MKATRFKAAMRVAVIHLGICLLVAVAVATLVFCFWFAGPYKYLSGGQSLFLLLVCVDMICGPLLTMVIFNPAKPRRELILDFCLVAFIQLGALIYGIYSIALARPVMLVYEVDRFVAITYAQIDPNDLNKALPEYRKFPLLSGPRLAGIRSSGNGEEMLHSIELSMAGKEPSLRPDWWQPYNKSKADVEKRMKPIKALMDSFDEEARNTLRGDVERTGMSVEKAFFLPLTSVKILDGWIVLLDDKANIRGYARGDGFI